MIKQELFDKLKSSGFLFTEDDVVFITEDTSGQLVWLEKGNENAGLLHIIKNHMSDFNSTNNLTEQELPLFLEEVITKGKIINSNPTKNGGYRKIYDYSGKYYTVVAMGSNGFIVTAFPTPKEE